MNFRQSPSDPAVIICDRTEGRDTETVCRLVKPRFNYPPTIEWEEVAISLDEFMLIYEAVQHELA